MIKEVINQIGGFCINRNNYGDTDSVYIHRKHWNDLVDNGFVSKSLGLSNIDYRKSSIFHAWFLAAKIKHCLVVDDFDVISAKRNFKGYSEEQWMIKLNEYISLSERQTVSSRFSIDWTKTSEGKKIPHRKQYCSDCHNGKICSDCVITPKNNCFNCKMERARKLCLDLLSQKRTYSTDFNM